MSQQHTSETRGGPVSAGRGAGQFIEKGWTVYDAAERPVGNVHDVDYTRNVLEVDGRPQGFEIYSIPLTMVDSASGNKVHLNKVVDTSAGALGGTPRFVDRPGATTTSSTVFTPAARASRKTATIESFSSAGVKR